MKHLANIFVENYRTGHVLVRSFGALADGWPRCSGSPESHESQRFSSRRAYNLSNIIDPEGDQQIQRRVRWDEVVEVVHNAVLPKEARGFMSAGLPAMEAPTTSPPLFMPRPALVPIL